MKQRFVSAHSLKRYSSSGQVMLYDSFHSEEAEQDAANAGLHITSSLLDEQSILRVGLPHSLKLPAFKDRPRRTF